MNRRRVEPERARALFDIMRRATWDEGVNFKPDIPTRPTERQEILSRTTMCSSWMDLSHPKEEL